MIDTQTQYDVVDDDGNQENETEVDVHDEMDDHQGSVLQTNVPRTKIKLTEAELVGQVGYLRNLIPDGPPPPPKKRKTGTVDFFRTCSDQQLSLFTLLDRASFPHYNNTKIITFG